MFRFAQPALVFDLLELWRGRNHDALRIAPWDNHPNLAGNRLIVDNLFQRLQAHAVALKLPSPAIARGQ